MRLAEGGRLVEQRKARPSGGVVRNVRKLRARLVAAVALTLGALAAGGLTAARAYPITGVSVTVTCSVSSSGADCVAVVSAADPNGNPVSGAPVRFDAAYQATGGQPVAGPGGPCGGMTPCSGTTGSDGRATSRVDTTVCNATLKVTAVVEDPSTHATRAASGQATLPACAGVAGASTGNGGGANAGSLPVGLPDTSTPPPASRDLTAGIALLGAGLLVAAGSGLALVHLRRRRRALPV